MMRPTGRIVSSCNQSLPVVGLRLSAWRGSALFSCMRGGLRDGCAQGLIERGEPSEMKRVNRPPNAHRDERGESRFFREPRLARGASPVVCEMNLGAHESERGVGLSTICKLWK